MTLSYIQNELLLRIDIMRQIRKSQTISKQEAAQLHACASYVKNGLASCYLSVLAPNVEKMQLQFLARDKFR